MCLMEWWERRRHRGDEWEKRKSRFEGRIEADNSLGESVGWCGGERKTVNERMKIEFRLHRREHCLRANKEMKRWPGAVLWLTVGQFPILLMAAPPTNSLSYCMSPTASVQYQLLKQLLGLPGGGHSAESAYKCRRLPVTKRVGRLRRQKKRGGEGSRKNGWIVLKMEI